MNAILDSLHQDHKNFAKLLGFLSEQLERVQHEGIPDFELLLDVVDYIESYPDLVHHPKEDIIFARYLETHDDGNAQIVMALMEDHRELKGMTAALRSSLEGILHDAPLERESLAQQLAGFLDRQWKHLNAEEADVFPMLQRVLSQEDWEAVVAEFPEKADPLFGGNLQQQYQSLYDRIISEANSLRTA